MKKTLAILCALLALSACNKQPLAPGRNQEIKVNIQVNRNDAFAGTKATVKDGWANGDVVFVFFVGVDAPKYLELKYNGSSWDATAKNGLETDDLENASLKKLMGLFLPYGSDLSIAADDSGKFIFQRDGETVQYIGWFLEGTAMYTCTDGLEATLDLAFPVRVTDYSGDKLVNFDVSGFDSGNDYSLYQEYVKPFVLEAVTAGGMDTAVLNPGDPIPGYTDGTTISFSGMLDRSFVGEELEYSFCINDKTEEVLYTRGAGSQTISDFTAVGLGDIKVKGSKWHAMPYVYLGIDNDSGQKICWAKMNLGATAEKGEGSYGRYFAFGDLTGYSAEGDFETGYSFSHTFDTCSEYELDENGNLPLSYDAADALLGWPWRLPTKGEFDALLNNSEYEAFETGSSDSGQTFTSMVEGYTDRTLFLPAAANAFGSDLQNPGIIGEYWSSTSSDELDDAAGYMLSFITPTYPGAPLIISVGSILTYFGLPIRPVFTLD